MSLEGHLGIFELWCFREVSKDWKKANIIPIFKNGKKEVSGKYRLLGLASVPGNAIEQMILETISRHMKDKKVI